VSGWPWATSRCGNIQTLRPTAASGAEELDERASFAGGMASVDWVEFAYCAKQYWVLTYRCIVVFSVLEVVRWQTIR
jgi:hypothetical protein